VLRTSFQTKLILTSLAAAVLALLVAGVFFTTAMRRDIDARIEGTLVAEARLASELLSASPLSTATADVTAPDLQLEAARIGKLLDARVTFIAADGRVVGDSAETLEALATLENHATRPEVVAAQSVGLGQARRYSATIKTDMLYVALPVRHPAIAVVRVALPLTDIRQQLRTVLVATLTALGIALVGGSALAVMLSRRIGQRVRAIAEVAARYQRGDLTPPRMDYGDDELGAVARTLDASVQDLARRLAELARDRGRMAAILSGMVEGVIVVDAQGRLELANNAAREMLKLGDLTIGRHYIEIIRHPAIADLVTKALAGHTPESVELAPPRDPSRTVMARAARSSANEAHGIVLVLHDITELKRVDRIRRDFVANVSHELRTPLTAIRGYVEALAEGDASPEESRRFLDIITRHALRMERLVKDLLRLARLDAGQETLEISACDVRRLVQNTVADLQPSLDGRGQQVEIDIHNDAMSVNADAAKLQDVLRNLITNASAYAPEHTTIRIVSRRDHDAIAIDVIDQGPGLPETELGRVFERFYRVDKSRARDPGGTGLGLAIVKHLMELHDGSVSVKNREEGGAQFTVTLKG
jgi:two-component system phosphate regulon sensor histidine kinase PhoR